MNSQHPTLEQVENVSKFIYLFFFCWSRSKLNEFNRIFVLK